MKLVKKDLVKYDDVKKDFVLVVFGSRWSLEVDSRFVSDRDIVNEYVEFCDEMIKDDMEYFIDEFGIMNNFVDGMWSICMSDDESRLWIERSKFEDICNELDDCDDNRVYEIVRSIEDKYELFV
tara:strand:- start:43 stop:414 length:372 start_codon:yes stop_codon:yes gene_type:complete